jgi:uncharacterized damage-inducible protein DinB
MPKAETATTSEIDTWRHQTRITQGVIRTNTKGLSHEDSLVQPSPAGNCLNWVVGHLMTVYDGVLPLLGQQPVLGTEVLKHYARGGQPIRDSSEALDFQQLLAAMNEAAERVDAGLAALSPDLLDQPAPTSPSGNPDETVRTLLTTVMWHQAYHTGQTGVLRRIAGKEGAIR